jgi:nucleotide-binding universal stress UspA family protein
MYTKILVPLDGSKLAECVLPHVEAIAKGCGLPEVVFVKVVEPSTGSDSQWGIEQESIAKMDKEHKAAAAQYLADVVKRAKWDGVKIKSQVIMGRAFEDIVKYANDNGVDLITIATHGRSGVSRWAWGSVADRVLRSTCVPTLMVRAPGCIPGI